jgi:hypothetical protein
LLAVNSISKISLWLEFLTLVLSMGLLLAPTQTLPGENTT